VLDEIAVGEEDEQLAEFSQAGRQRIAEQYQWDSVTDEYEAMLSRLADLRGRPRRGRSAATEASA